MCSRCDALRTECDYESEQDESRWTLLRRRCQTLETERNDLRELVGLLRSEPEQRSQQILQRLRASPYAQFSHVLQEFRRDPDNAMRRSSIALSQASTEQRLPGIRAMLGDIDVPHATVSKLPSDLDSMSSGISNSSG